MHNPFVAVFCVVDHRIAMTNSDWIRRTITSGYNGTIQIALIPEGSNSTPTLFSYFIHCVLDREVVYLIVSKIVMPVIFKSYLSCCIYKMSMPLSCEKKQKKDMVVLLKVCFRCKVYDMKKACQFLSLLPS